MELEKQVTPIMDPYKETFDTWDKVAKLYQDKFMNLDLYNDSYDLFCEHITKSNAAVLEIGCGPGNITKYLLNKLPDLKIEAIDVSSNMIALARANCPTANFRVMDAREIDKLAMKFDAIICGFCLPYLSKTDVSKMLKDCIQLLNNNGVIYLSFVGGERNQSGYQTGGSGDRIYFYYHPLDDITSELKNNRLEVANILHKNYSNAAGVEEMHTILIAKKS